VASSRWKLLSSDVWLEAASPLEMSKGPYLIGRTGACYFKLADAQHAGRKYPPYAQSYYKLTRLDHVSLSLTRFNLLSLPSILKTLQITRYSNTFMPKLRCAICEESLFVEKFRFFNCG
jgi:hypothetical protein